jgi:hypothetical protein
MRVSRPIAFRPPRYLVSCGRRGGSAKHVSDVRLSWRARMPLQVASGVAGGFIGRQPVTSRQVCIYVEALLVLLGLSMEGEDIYILLVFALLCWRRPGRPVDDAQLATPY